MFHGETLNFLNMLLSFISSIHNAMTSDGRNFNHIKMQVSVLVSVLTLAAIPIAMRYEIKGYLEIYRYFVMIVSIFLVTVVAVRNLPIFRNDCVYIFSNSSSGDVHKLSCVTETVLCKNKRVFM
jgi:hypothetical protein